MKQLYQQLTKSWRQQPLPHIINRQANIAELIDPKLKKIITITGFRRVGKTYLMLNHAKQLGQQNCIFLNLEDERIPAKIASLTQFSDFLTENNFPPTTTLLLDEIQRIPDWEQWVNRLHHSTQYQLILSGSSSKLSSSELPTQLRGRSLNLHLNPLNFKEFLNFKQTNYPQLPSNQQLSFLKEFLQYGGLPEIVLTDPGKKHLILNEYLNTFITRDIIDRHQLRKPDTLGALINLLLNSKELTVNKLTNTLKSLGHSVSKPTIASYLKYFQESYFLQTLLWHNSNVKNRLQAARKAYFIDSFFIYHYSKFSQENGRLMEQKVYQKLHQQAQKKPQLELYYWRNQQRYEVDFVLQKKEKTQQLIQVSYLRPNTLLPERELHNLALAGKNLSCDNLVLITWDLETQKRANNQEIQLIPLAKFLLE